MRRAALSILLALSLSVPARAEDARPLTAQDRAFWIGVSGAGLTLLGGGLWLESVRRIDEATARGDGLEAERARHLGAIGGSLAFTGLSALAVAAVLSSWRTEPVQVSLSVSPAGWSVQLVGRTF